MKISNYQGITTTNKTNRDTNKRVGENKPNETNGVKIEISSSAKELINRINQFENPNHSVRVEDIRKSVINGSYSVDPKNIADKIIEVMISEKGSV